MMPVAISALTATMLAFAGQAAAVGQSGTDTTSAVPTACSLMSPQEIAGITAKRVQDGEPEGTECRFRTSDGNWVHVALAPMDAKTFAKFRGLFGTKAESQAGVGDEAYFYGKLRIYVRVGTHSLIVDIARNDQGDATTKAQVLALAKLGASRLR